MQVALTVLVAAFGVLVWVGRVTPLFLLTFSFLAATAAALILPEWQSIVPQLVPRERLQPAVALNVSATASSNVVSAKAQRAAHPPIPRGARSSASEETARRKAAK